MEQSTSLHESLAKKVIRFIIAIAVLITILSLILRFSIIKAENTASIEDHIDAFSRAVAPTLIQNLDNGTHEELDMLIQSFVDSENFSTIKLKLSTGSSVSEKTFVSQGETEFKQSNKSEKAYSYPYDGGIADMSIIAYEPWFSPDTISKLINHLLLMGGGLAALIFSVFFFMNNFVFSHIYHIADYLGSRTTTNLSSPLTLNRSKDPKSPPDDFDRVVNAIEKMRMALINDIEQRQAIERALNEEKEEKLETQRLINEAKAANKAKSEFIATMSHEIRTPLNGVVGMVEMLRDTPLNNNQKHYLDVLYRSGESLLEIINDILDYSKIESGRMLLEKISFDLEELIDNCFKLFGATASKRDIELISNIAPDTPTKLVGDPTRLRQILVNLVGNAFKFTGQGFVILKVKTETNTQDQNVKLLFSISDSGIGISEQDQSHLFEAFRQADSSTTRKFGGSGLGLAICKQLAELMGGEIGIESEKGKGSTFWFTARFSADEEALYGNPPSCSLGLSNKSLLAINLSDSLIKGLRQHVPSWNLKIEILDTNTTSIEDKLNNKRVFFDFILIDHQANDGAGFEIANAIRNIDRYQMSPLLMLSNQQASSFSQMQLYTVSSIVPRPIAIQNLKNILIAQCYGTQLNPLMPVEQKKPNRSELNVLVAEDNAVNRMVIEGLLGKFEIHPEFAENGVEAVKKFFDPDKKYDLILMDCEMPELDGFDATEQIREEEKNRAISSTPIIALTAHVEASHRQRVFDCGMNHFLSKPVTLDKLNEALNSVGLNG